MLTSDAKQFVFVHIQKAAGTVLNSDLKRQVPDARKLGFEHDGARVAIDLMGREAWDRAFTFAIVRNPWDRMVSWWSMIDQRRPLKAQPNQPQPKPVNPLWDYAQSNARTFEEFVLRCTDEIPDEKRGTKSFVRTQTDFLVDRSGEFCVEFIGRAESFEDDYAVIRQRLGLGKADLSHKRNRSKHKHYSTYYNDRTREIIAERFATDIERFGYEFQDRPRGIRRALSLGSRG